MRDKVDTEKEVNLVADNHNWVQRIEAEMESSRVWERNWGKLYTVGEPIDYQGKIQKLEAKIKQLPVQSKMTNSQLSYTWERPYKEPTNHRIKSYKAIEDSKLQSQINKELEEA